MLQSAGVAKSYMTELMNNNDNLLGGLCSLSIISAKSQDEIRGKVLDNKISPTLIKLTY